MSGFFCAKRREQMAEPCAWCEDCPGDSGVELVASFMAVDEDLVTPEFVEAMKAEGWERC